MVLRLEKLLRKGNIPDHTACTVYYFIRLSVIDDIQEDQVALIPVNNVLPPEPVCHDPYKATKQSDENHMIL